ncbi:MAG: hypothetical protein ABJQ90_12210 [Parasphingorhabdus sp.]
MAIVIRVGNQVYTGVTPSRSQGNAAAAFGLFWAKLVRLVVQL